MAAAPQHAVTPPLHRWWHLGGNTPLPAHHHAHEVSSSSSLSYYPSHILVSLTLSPTLLDLAVVAGQGEKMAMQIQRVMTYDVATMESAASWKRAQPASSYIFCYFFLVITAGWYKRAGGDHHFHRRFENRWGWNLLPLATFIVERQNRQWKGF